MSTLHWVYHAWLQIPTTAICANCIPSLVHLPYPYPIVDCLAHAFDTLRQDLKENVVSLIIPLPEFISKVLSIIVLI